MAIELSKLNVVVPEGFTISKEPAIEGDKVKLEITSDVEVKGIILAKYDGDSESISIASRKFAKLVEFGNKDIHGLKAGFKYVIPAKFDSVVDPTLTGLKLPLGWALTNKTLSEDGLIVNFEVLTPNEAREQDVLTLTYRGETSDYTLNVIKSANMFMSVKTKASVYEIGREFEVELSYSNYITDEDLPTEITPSEGLKLVSNTPEVVGKKAYYTFVGETSGEKTVTMVAYKGDKQNQAARMCKVTIR